MCVIEQNRRNITVRVTNARWNRLMELERAYAVAQRVARAKKQVAEAEDMTLDEALAFVE